MSSFQVFLGLKEDLLRKTGITDSEIFIETSYDPESAFAAALRGDVESGGVSVTLYDNVDADYSPKGKNTINLMILQTRFPISAKDRAVGLDHDGAIPVLPTRTFIKLSQFKTTG